MFTRAIVRPPATNFADGLTTAGLGAPDYGRAIRQHGAYCAALEQCGLTLTRLEADPDFPDSTFVEDAAILIEDFAHDPRSDISAVITRPGAASRLGEITSIRKALNHFSPSLYEIDSPGTVDGGDVCQAGRHFFIGVSERTNESGAQQLAEILGRCGYASSLVDIRPNRAMKSVPGANPGPHAGSPRGVVVAAGALLHLKSGIAYLGDNRLAITEEMRRRGEFAGYDLAPVGPDEAYAANCVRVNDYVLVASGFPAFDSGLKRLGYRTIALEMSEFQKMDGGLSCLSLRF